ncbi:MAG: hypothetical protein BWK74_01375 [Desulfobacteraceae bacterium A6]|nr:MAG: hypothetical protein BWK74_01375 [Desulfobacteraceae bacterium A6]
MQIDFHLCVTYVVSRLAGFGHREAETVAHCAQYVDDATNSGTIKFDNGAMFSRTSSAHKILDYKNFNELANRYVWIPFHFLPGNNGKKAGENPEGTFIEKLICRPGSFVAKDMINACIRGGNALYGLHRLGIALHVYADTWAHQGFAGVINEINAVKKLDDEENIDAVFGSKLKKFFGDIFDDIACEFASGIIPLGHGAALSLPDRPYLKWTYKDSRGNTVARDNPAQFLEAAHEMCRAVQRFRAGNPDADVPGLANADRERIMRMMTDIKDENGDERCKKWIDALKEGFFGFPPVTLGYIPKGAGSWKYQAIGSDKEVDIEAEKHPYSPSFLGSDWKLFHDALMAHRFSIINEILPRYGICAA